MHDLLWDRVDGEESKVHQEYLLDNIAFSSKASMEQPVRYKRDEAVILDRHYPYIIDMRSKEDGMSHEILPGHKSI